MYRRPFLIGMIITGFASLAGCVGISVDDVEGEFREPGVFVVRVLVENSETSIETEIVRAEIVIDGDERRTQTKEVTLGAESSEELTFVFDGLDGDLTEDDVEYGAEIE